MGCNHISTIDPAFDRSGAMPGQGWLNGPPRYAAAIACVGIAFLTRFALDPVFGTTSFIFSAFYLAVVVTAYFAGSGPAIVASFASAGLAYWAFAAPAYALKVNPEALTSMSFFALTSAVDIYFITGMTRAVQLFRAERLRAELLAEGHANLFREFNEHATNHLQLVAALLQLRATDGLDATYAHSLAEASARTMLISRVHRSLLEDRQLPTAFASFARQLANACIDNSLHPNLTLEVSGEEVCLPAEQAASLAIIVFESCRVLIHSQRERSHGHIQLEFVEAERGYRFRLASSTATKPIEPGLFQDELTRQIIDATVAQLSGHISWKFGLGGLTIEVTLPRFLSSAELIDRSISTEQAARTLH